jgi:hypothetical protein
MVWFNLFSIAPNSALIEETFSIAPSITRIALLAPDCVFKLIALVAFSAAALLALGK